MTQPLLLQPLTIKGLTLKNRVAISPMCQYSAIEGVAQDWHLVHLGRFAIGGAGLVIVEATGVEARGRITHGDMGLWNDEQARALARIVDFLKANGSAAGIQLAHAGRKASTHRPWQGGGPLTATEVEGPWETVAPSALPFSDGYDTPKSMSTADMAEVIIAFRESAKRALDCGFDVVEVHAAHGYLLHEFLSPLSNHRTDAYGGGRDGRMRFPLEVVETVRAVWPQDKPLFVRTSSVDWVEGGLTIEDTVAFAKACKALGVDLLDCSSGGNSTTMPHVFPGYQVAFAAAVRKDAQMMTGAVGLILSPEQAEKVLQDGEADLIFLARKALDDPNFALHAVEALTGEIDYSFAPAPAKSGLDRLAGPLKRLKAGG